MYGNAFALVASQFRQRYLRVRVFRMDSRSVMTPFLTGETRQKFHNDSDN